ncbi:MAG: TonB-dependent receptor [Bacteroidota bacterium]|nr:TonB-dependent receptor [Bacteroidota bacterium]
MKVRIGLILGLCLIQLQLFAATTGKIAGKVVDAKSGEELLGVTVQIEGTSLGAATDFEGKFLINQVQEGTHTLVFSYVSYQKKKVTNIKVKTGDITTVQISLEESTQDLGEVVITGELRKETHNALLIQQRNATAIGNGVSADMIKQTPDKNTGEAMKRISGTTIQQGKFAIIRGLNDRYNAAMINGSPLPSTEPERRAFSFDLIPSNMLDQIVVVKTATPDLPGDFAGGVIRITTKEAPIKPFFNVQVSSEVNSITTGRDFRQNQGSPTDKFGFDNGVRRLPDAFPTTETLRTGSNLERTNKEIEAGKLLNNNYAILNQTAMPNFGLQISGGKNYKVSKNSELGVVFSTSYSQSRSFQEVQRSWADFAKNTQFNYVDSLYEESARIGGLLNVSYKFGSNRISFKNTVNVNSEDQTTLRVGPSQAEGIYKQAYSYVFTQNRMLLNQLNGEHSLNKNKFKLNWELSRAGINRNMPDYKNVEYRGDNPENVALAVGFLANENAARLFTNLDERLYSAATSISLPVDKHSKHNLKMGVFYQYKERDFDGRMLGFAKARTSGFDESLRSLSIDKVFSYENMSLTGFKLNDITSPYHKYQATSNVKAGYFMMENKIGARLKAIYGVRYESYNQTMVSATRNNEAVDVNTTFNDFLPSLNLVYALNSTSNLRFSASKTVSRPELRELAPFSFYDFSTASSLEGNPNLQRAVIQNYDLRYEIYPGLGQVFSVSLFYKNFENPIEQVLANDISLGVIRRVFVNLPQAKSLGIEFDYYYNFTKWLIGYGNFSYISSTINAGDNPNRWNENRPMQGQSPYIINVGMLYKVERIDLTFSGLFNMYGDRIYNVGNTSFPDIYEAARPLLDFQVSKSFLDKRMMAKFSVTDILARDLIFFMDFAKKSKYTEDTDFVVFQHQMPRIFSMSLSYRL